MSTGGRYGLVIASSEYEDPTLSRLGAPAHDAEALARVLSDPTVGGFTVQTLVNRPSYEVQHAVARFFTDRRRDDLLLLYFSGHGLKDDAGRLFLATPNTERRLPDATSVPAAFVRDAMDRARARQNVLVLDCCYSGAFAAGAKGDGALHTREGFAASGSVVLTASDAVEYSYEADSAGGRPESVFTRIVVEGLTSGDADRDTDGDVSLDELYDYVHDRMLAERPDQRPGKWAWDVHGRIVVARNPRWRLPARLREAADSPLPAFRLAAVEELGALLRTGNAEVARIVRQALTRLADDDSRKVSRAATDLLSPPTSPTAATPVEPASPKPAGGTTNSAGPAGAADPAAEPKEQAGEAGPAPSPIGPPKPGRSEAARPHRPSPAAADPAARQEQQRKQVTEKLRGLEGTIYGSQRQKLTDKITGAGRMIAAYRCCHKSDNLRHTVVIINSEYLIWSREAFLSRATAAWIPWSTVTSVEDYQLGVIGGVRIRHGEDTVLELDNFTGKGVQLGDEKVAHDLKSIVALIRRLAGAGQAG